MRLPHLCFFVVTGLAAGCGGDPPPKAPRKDTIELECWLLVQCQLEAKQRCPSGYEVIDAVPAEQGLLDPGLTKEEADYQRHAHLTIACKPTK